MLVYVRINYIYITNILYCINFFNNTKSIIDKLNRNDIGNENIF